jgi:hypothetical protein
MFRGVAFRYLGQYKRAYESYDHATGQTAQQWKPLKWATNLLHSSASKLKKDAL